MSVFSSVNPYALWELYLLYYLLVMPAFTNSNISVTEGLFLLFYKYELIVLNNRLHFPISYELKHCHDLRDTVYDVHSKYILYFLPLKSIELCSDRLILAGWRSSLCHSPTVWHLPWGIYTCGSEGEIFLGSSWRLALKYFLRSYHPPPPPTGLETYLSPCVNCGISVLFSYPSNRVQEVLLCA